MCISRWIGTEEEKKGKCRNKLSGNPISSESGLVRQGENLQWYASVDPRRPVCSIEFLQLPPQWINCDVRRFDYTVLGKFHVIMADPPWDIHMSVSLL